MKKYKVLNLFLLYKSKPYVKLTLGNFKPKTHARQLIEHNATRGRSFLLFFQVSNIWIDITINKWQFNNNFPSYVAVLQVKILNLELVDMGSITILMGRSVIMKNITRAVSSMCPFLDLPMPSWVVKYWNLVCHAKLFISHGCCRSRDFNPANKSNE